MATGRKINQSLLVKHSGSALTDKRSTGLIQMLTCAGKNYVTLDQPARLRTSVRGGADLLRHSRSSETYSVIL